MKKHAIIPIFIPHLGCPHSCVFCNQKAITAHTADVCEADVRNTAEAYLSTLEGLEGCETELSFFGGSFTGIPIERQSEFLAIAKEYKDSGRINKIHMSTRPDYIGRRILDNLAAYGADVIELGVQSFDEKVLRLSERGHSAEQVFEACELIKEYGFILGIQLMTGLPGDSYEACMDSVRQTVRIKPEIARIYPTAVIEGTKLASMYLDGSYVPFTLEESVRTAKDMYLALTGAGINVIRVGLKSSDFINDGKEGSKVLGNTYHPAFRQLVEGEIAKEKIEEHLNELSKSSLSGSGLKAEVIIRCGSKAFGAAIGHKACNKRYFSENYPEFTIKYISDAKIRENAMYFGNIVL